MKSRALQSFRQFRFPWYEFRLQIFKCIGVDYIPTGARNVQVLPNRLNFQRNAAENNFSIHL